ncbi:hypothetical protein D3C75_1045100 [compost metagenome]
MSGGNAVAYGKAQPGAAVLRGIKGSTQLLQHILCHPAAFIGDPEQDGRPVKGGSDPQRAAGVHAVQAVQGHIQDHLADFLLIQPEIGDGIKLGQSLLAVHHRLRLDQRENGLNNGIQAA